MTEQERQKIKMAWAKGEEVQYWFNNNWVDWNHSDWLSLSSVPWRVKPKTININGYEVPEPIRSLEEGDAFYTVWHSVTPHRHYVGSRHEDALKAGWCHSTKEAAELHYKALISFTKAEE